MNIKKRSTKGFPVAFAILLLTAASAFAQQNPVPFIDAPLVPTTVAPGGPGFALTVDGAGFVQGSVVNWNGSARATTFVTGSQLTASIMAADIAAPGTASVTVANPGTTTSNTVFLTITSPTVSTSMMPASWIGSFGATATVVADFNGDDKLDAASVVPASLWVAVGNGDGTFQTPTNYLTANGALESVALTVGDFNGDGKLDIAVLNVGGNQGSLGNVAIFLGNGDGTFQQPLFSQTDYVPASIVAADFNGDGKLDIAVTGNSGYQNAPVNPTIALLFGNGDGTFQPYVELPAAYGTFGGPLVAGDFNGDGIADLATYTTTGESYNVALTFLGNGDGTFQPPKASTIGYQPQVFAAADVNGDGKLDLIVPNLCGNIFGCDNSQNVPSSVSVLLGNGDGSFQTNVEYTVGIFPVGVGIGDFNGDGKLDLAVGTQCGSSPSCENMGIDSLSVLLGNGDGTFQPQIMPSLVGPQTLLGGLVSMTTGDLNGDGLPDLIASRTISVNLQSTLLPSTTNLNFANQTVGSSSSPQASTLSNISTKVPITVSSAQVSGTNASDFAVKTTCSKLQPKSACKVNVTFTPTGSGTRTATVLITDSAVGSPHQITVTGTGAAPAVSLSSTAMNFGMETVGTRSPIHFLNLTNSGNGTLTISGIAASGDFTESSNCGGKLNPGKSCKISVAFRPTKVGARAGKLTISDNAAGGSQTVALTGTGR
jgi:hypothetical protein